MLTVKDRKYLETIGGRSGARLQRLQYFVPVVLMMTSIFNVWIASLWGRRLGYSLPDLVRLYMVGTDASKSYSGILIRAEDQLEMALLSFGVAVLTLVIAFHYQAIRQRHLRIIDALK